MYPNKTNLVQSLIVFFMKQKTLHFDKLERSVFKIREAFSNSIIKILK